MVTLCEFFGISELRVAEIVGEVYKQRFLHPGSFELVDALFPDCSPAEKVKIHVLCTTMINERSVT